MFGKGLQHLLASLVKQNRNWSEVMYLSEDSGRVRSLIYPQANTNKWHMMETIIPASYKACSYCYTRKTKAISPSLFRWC